jgi:hypothetical protein
MSKIYQSIAFVCVWLVASNCAVVNVGPKKNALKIDEANFRQLNVMISNHPKEVEGKVSDMVTGQRLEIVSFWTAINGSHREWPPSDSLDNKLVSINFESPKKLNLKLLKKDSLLEQKVIKVRIKNGYVYSRKYFFGIPLFPVLFGYNTKRYRIGMTPDTVTLDFRWNSWFFALLAGNYSKGYSSSSFSLKRN